TIKTVDVLSGETTFNPVVIGVPSAVENSTVSYVVTAPSVIPPTLTLTAVALVEGSGEFIAGDIVANFVVSDADSPASVDFTAGSNTEAYFAINGTNVILTSSGAAHLNAGGSLPIISLTATDGNTPVTQTAVPNVALTDDVPSLTLTAVALEEGNDTFLLGDIVANFTLSDPDSDETVGFTAGTNTEGYYAITGSTVTLTSAGAAHLNAGGTLPTISLTATDGTTPVTQTAVPNIIIGVNIAPLNSITTTSFTVAEDASLAITGLTVSDVDSGTSLTTTLSVANGVLNVTPVDGLIINSNGSASLSLVGSQSAINAALATLTYQGNLNHYGSDTLTVVS
ncbi:MAG: hypothetical protein U1A04_10075, partial [Moraxellaceae bacterium]|nr:hypothetical protein [Moraxellaceae bacterium]